MGICRSGPKEPFLDPGGVDAALVGGPMFQIRNGVDGLLVLGYSALY